MRRSLATALVVAIVAAGCLGRGRAGTQKGRADAGSGGQGGEGDQGGAAPLAVPTEPNALAAYLAAHDYAWMRHDLGPRPSFGPHGTMRVFVDPALEGSLAAGALEQPAGAAAVAEIWAHDGTTFLGWDVSVKRDADSAGGLGWYWFEWIGNTAVEGFGLALCVDCHAAGSDFVHGTLPSP